MKKLLILFSLLTLASCGPKTYLGPLDSPEGSWKGIVSKYYFNGEYVYEAPGCTYSAISFYADSLCCIEGIKGAFNWTYSSDSLVVDTTIWRAAELSGRLMTLEYIGVIENEDATPNGNGIEADKYNETVIYGDGSKYWYLDADGLMIPCFPVIGTASDGFDSTVCWWNTRSDYYNPL